MKEVFWKFYLTRAGWFDECCAPSAIQMFSFIYLFKYIQSFHLTFSFHERCDWGPFFGLKVVFIYFPLVLLVSRSLKPLGFGATSHWDNRASRSNFAADTEVCWGFTAAEFSAQRLLSQSHLQQHECSLFERRHAGLCLFVFLFYRHSFATVVHTVQLSLKRDCTMRIVRKETAWICLGAWGIATAGGEVLNFR